MDETIMMGDTEQDNRDDEDLFGQTSRNRNVKKQGKNLTQADNSEVIGLLKHIMHEQREQRDQIRRIEAIVQSKFMMDEDNLQSLL